MKRFLWQICVFLLFPLGVVIGLYMYIDPFRVTRPFTMEYVNEKPLYKLNREYFNFNIFNKQYTEYQYNSFIIGSSRTTAFNTYHWKDYLETDAQPFIFTSWRENIEGMRQKLVYFDSNNIDVRNVLLLFDCGEMYSFNLKQGDAPLTNHYWKLNGESRIKYQLDYFSAFISQPTRIPSFIKDYRNKLKDMQVDTITCDNIGNDTIRLCPEHDYLAAKDNFPPQPDESELEAYIDDDMYSALMQIKDVFAKHNTSYKVIVLPNYFHWKLNIADLQALQSIFGDNNVYDLSGNHPLNGDKYSYNDEEHFDANIGWQIIDYVYSQH